MTTIVTRLYETAEVANRVAETLKSDGFPDATLSVITEADVAQMTEARVDEEAATTYAKAMSGTQALFVCRAPFIPFGAARRAIEVADGEQAIDAGVENENRHVEEIADRVDVQGASILTDHPLIATRSDYVGSGWSSWRFSDMFLWPTISRRSRRPDNLLTGRAILGGTRGALVTTKARKSSVISGGAHMSRKFWPMPLVTTGTKDSVLKDHPRFSERLGLRTISRR